MVQGDPRAASPIHGAWYTASSMPLWGGLSSMDGGSTSEWMRSQVAYDLQDGRGRNHRVDLV